jgi:hypothetical protein
VTQQTLFGATKGQLVFVMLNPSSAGANKDDPTIRKCNGYASRLDYAPYPSDADSGATFSRCKRYRYGLWRSGLLVVNLFGFIATEPKRLAHAASANVDVVGPKNDATLRAAFAATDCVVAAWGEEKWPFVAERARVVRRMASDAGADMKVLALTQDGHPRHPLYLKYDLQPVAW